MYKCRAPAGTQRLKPIPNLDRPVPAGDTLTQIFLCTRGLMDRFATLLLCDFQNPLLQWFGRLGLLKRLGLKPDSPFPAQKPPLG
jgi:hypothetical protein